MKKKLSFVVIAVLILGVVGVIYLLQRSSTSPQVQDATLQQAQEEAIRQAEQYRPEGLCTQSLVLAVHKSTGAKYTFSSGCLAISPKITTQDMDFMK